MIGLGIPWQHHATHAPARGAGDAAGGLVARLAASGAAHGGCALFADVLDGENQRRVDGRDGTEKTATLDAGAVQDWVDGTLANNGLTMQINVGGSNNSGFVKSSDHADAEERPKLGITYTEAAAGGVFVMPTRGIGLLGIGAGR